MLRKRRCERTGIINFFVDSESFLAAGSIVQIAPSQFVWRSHIDDTRVGIASHLFCRRSPSLSRTRKGPSASHRPGRL